MIADEQVKVAGRVQSIEAYDFRCMRHRKVPDMFTVHMNRI